MREGKVRNSNYITKNCIKNCFTIHFSLVMSSNLPSKNLEQNSEKLKKVRKIEEKRSGTFMLKYLKPSEVVGPGKDNLEPPPATIDIADTTRVETNILEEPFGNKPEDETEEGQQIETNQRNKNSNAPETTTDNCIGESYFPAGDRSNLNSNIVIYEEKNTFDPASIVGKPLSDAEKEALIRTNPCQPTEGTLKQRKSKHNDRFRYCSQSVFHNDSKTRRKWVSYSLMKDSLFCVPCLLFSSPASVDSQGNAFTITGFSNWKKQYGSVVKHERTACHLNAKVAEVLFLKGDTIKSAFDRQEAMEADRRKKTVLSNRNIMKRIVDATIFLGKQGLSFRGHRESLTNAFGNNGNFLELLKLMSEYDATTKDHLSKVTAIHRKVPEQRGGKRGAKGRGSKLTFLSKDSQNKLIRIIGEEITSEVVEKVKTCRSWALIADTTPDVTHKEQLSICVRVVNETGECSEHLLSCQRATGTKADELYSAIMTTFELQGATFEKLVAQTYDGASNMSGCYNGLHALVKRNVGNHVAYVHCYAHAPNFVLSDAAGATINGDLVIWKRYTIFSVSHIEGTHCLKTP